MTTDHATGWTCGGCERTVFLARQWHDGTYYCGPCYERQLVFRHEVAEAIREGLTHEARCQEAAAQIRARWAELIRKDEMDEIELEANWPVEDK